MTYLLPPQWTDTMIPLQQQCYKSSLAEINQMFIKDLGKSIDEIFVEFDPNPIGVASLAQVHKAKMLSKKDETVHEIAVKCQHPSLINLVPLDVMLTAYVFQVLDWWFPEYSLIWLAEEMRESIFVELDFRNEKTNADKTSNFFKDKCEFLTVPKVFDAYKRIIMMEYITGDRIDQFDYEGKKISRSRVSKSLDVMLNEMVFTDSVGIHTDIHGGNIAIKYNEKKKNNFEIILYDHGLYRYPDNETRLLYSNFWISLLNKDLDGIQENLQILGNVSEEEFPLLAACLTGRSINTIMNEDLLSEANTLSLRDEERDEMRRRFLSDYNQGGDIFLQLMSILSKIPSVVLLLLKANDLNRHLQESLLSHGENSNRSYLLDTIRSYLMVGKYASRNIYQNDRKHSHLWLLIKYGIWNVKLCLFDIYIGYRELRSDAWYWMKRKLKRKSIQSE
ncbi:hypothetical protein QEN19_003363 [Hanseniaspora menglaensis]